MNYNEALEIWGKKQLPYPDEELRNVAVDQEINPGFACCGGQDPDCYCSFAESPSVYIEVRAQRLVNKRWTWISQKVNSDFTTILRELFELSEGN